MGKTEEKGEALNNLRRFRYEQTRGAFEHYDNTTTLIATLTVPILTGLWVLSFSTGITRVAVTLQFGVSWVIYILIFLLYRRQNNYTRQLSNWLQKMEAKDFILLYSELEKKKPFDMRLLFAVGSIVLVLFWTLRILIAT